MSDIHERIKKLGEMFKEMQVTEVKTEAEVTNVIYVVVSFPPKWIIDDNVQEKFNVSVMDGASLGDHYFCADISIGFDAVFDAIDYCINVNKDAMARAQIFQEKLKELKELFANGENTINMLKTIEFTFPKQKKTTKKMSPIDEVVNKEIEEDEKITEKNE